MLKLIYKHKLYFLYIPLAIHWISIFILTSLPDKDLPSFELHDKWKHFIAYFVLSFFLTLTLRVQNRFKKAKLNFTLYTLLITLIYSTFDEIHQAFIPGRSAEILDWIANLIGLILGLYTAKFILKKADYDSLESNGTEIS